MDVSDDDILTVARFAGFTSARQWGKPTPCGWEFDWGGEPKNLPAFWESLNAWQTHIWPKLSDDENVRLAWFGEIQKLSDGESRISFLMHADAATRTKALAAVLRK